MGMIVRATDINASGGAAQGGFPTVTAGGLPVMVPNMPVLPHPPCGPPPGAPHCSAMTSGGSGTVTAGGQPVITTDDSDTCGDKRLLGLATVMVGK